VKAEEIEMFSFSPKIVFVLLCIITFLVPFEELLEIPESATGIFLTAAVALAVSFFAVLTGLRQRKLPSALILLAVFILWCIVSLYWTVDPEQTVQSSFTYISLLLLTWMIFPVCQVSTPTVMDFYIVTSSGAAFHLLCYL